MDDLRIRAFKLIFLAALRELTFLRSLCQAHHHLLKRLHDNRDIVDRQLHLFVIAFVGLRDQFVDLAVGDLGKNAVALADWQQDGIQHFVDALHYLAIDAFKLVRPSTFGETALARCVDQAQNLLRDEHYFPVP